ncbi:monovalent cation/H+ antiporter complex subunit F [Tessaracoccus caeni]|uniref:monovalent cation/H+ antiporter complex subunit F n=1 Tax=Tessaracoccus caeni TaxID=3031239 RepID=UPI0023DB1B07|nr:monovalent cation/H+ antiporter complex subunit F [Tessaracoccus caeni]MDF1487328.1 monovalent cation/H+ antiporter complex subunit F [Tessaracoccus caeni]
MSLAVMIILGIAGAALFATALIAIWRIVAGPSQLDRSIAADLMVAVVIASVGIWIIGTRSDTELGILLLLSMFGFTGAVGISRMVSDRLVQRRQYDRLQNDRKRGQ